MKYLSILFAILATVHTVVGQEQHFDNEEKEDYIYGDGKPKTAKDIQRLEIMWQIDEDISKTRGFIQGFNRGFYKNYSYEIEENCFGKSTTRVLYLIQQEFDNFDILRLPEIWELFYNIYYMFDYQCRIEQILWDLSNFCFDNNCEGEKLLQNEMAHVF